MKSLSMRSWILVLMGLGTLVSCSAPQSTRSNLRDLAANKNAKNVALIFGAENDLPGVNKDVTELAQLFSNPTFGFQVNLKDQAASTTMLQESASVAASLDENSTLIWYYSGHGSEDGSLFAQDQQPVYMSEVIAAMQSARKTPFKRLIVVMDSCFSGQNVDGTSAILSAAESQASLTGAVNTMHTALNKSVSASANARPFEQAIILAAARSNQTSADAGETMGGVFTYSWRTTIGKLLQNKSATIAQMLNETISVTKQNGDGDPDAQVPVFRASPSSILNEPLVGPGSGSDNNMFRAYIRLAGADETRPVMQVSVPQTAAAATMVMCAGDLAACRLANAANSPFQFVQTSSTGFPGRAFFVSQSGISLQSNTVYTMIFRNAAGAEVGAQSIRAISR